MTHSSQGPAPLMTTVDEYDGSSHVQIAATQLDSDCSAYQARKIVDEWCAFFAAGPSPIVDLAFTSRTPKRLFASLRGQIQVESLEVKWGDYDDLGPLTGMRNLHSLRLGGASSVHTLDPLAQLPQLRELVLDSLRHVRDLSPLAALRRLRSLDVGGGLTRIAHVDSIRFLRQLPDLERLGLYAIIVDDLDYSPLMALTKVTELFVMPARGMRPSHDELRSAIPALEPLPI